MDRCPLSGVHAIILAAGASSRMGEPKQLLKIGNKTLLNHCVEEVSKAPFTGITLTLGANAERIIPTLPANAGVEIFRNPNYHEGLGNSIASSVQHIRETAAPEAIILILADQPYLKAEHLRVFLEQHESGTDEILISNYQNGNSGPPVLFTSRFYPELCQLGDDQGAKRVISKYPEQCRKIDLKGFVPVDIDTPEDYQRLMLDFKA